MLFELYGAVEQKCNQLRVEFRKVNLFRHSQDGWQYSKNYPSVGYKIDVDRINDEEYLYNNIYEDEEGFLLFKVAVISGVGSVSTRTWYNNSFGGISGVQTGYEQYHIWRHPTPYIVRLELMAKAKTWRDDAYLQESIMEVFGDRGYITVTLSDFNNYVESYDMFQTDIQDFSDLHRRIENVKGLFVRKYVYEIEAWKYFSTTYNAPGVTQRLYRENFVRVYSTPTESRYETVATGTYALD